MTLAWSSRFSRLNCWMIATMIEATAAVTPTTRNAQPWSSIVFKRFVGEPVFDGFGYGIAADIPQMPRL